MWGFGWFSCQWLQPIGGSGVLILFADIDNLVLMKKRYQIVFKADIPSGTKISTFKSQNVFM